MTTHYDLMNLALEHASEALNCNEVPISAILWHPPTSSVLSKAHNLTNATLNGTAHAEFHLYEDLKSKHPQHHLKLWKESVLYVTVEPCIMCASLLNQLQVKSVVFGCANDRFGGNGSVFRIQDQYNVIPGVLNHEAITLLRQFYIRENEASPTAIGKKKRVLNLNDFPQLDYSKYIDLKEFIKIWGEEYTFIWENNLPLEFNKSGELINKKRKHLIHEKEQDEKNINDIKRHQRLV